jgi:hypothetical protein
MILSLVEPIPIVVRAGRSDAEVFDVTPLLGVERLVLAAGARAPQVDRRTRGTRRLNIRAGAVGRAVLLGPRSPVLPSTAW